MAIVIRGRVFTGIASRPVYEAVVVENERISYVGWMDEALRVAGRDAEVIDFGDHLVTPGLIDSHCHMAVAGLYMELGTSLQGARSIADIVERIRREALARGEGEWIYAYGLDESMLKEGRLPTRLELDEAAPRNPVVLEHVSGHLVVVNTEALRRAGITKSTENPPGGVIERDSSGEPTGVLYDAAMSLVYRVMPPPSREHWFRGLRKAQKTWLTRGFTSVEDAGTFGAWSNIVSAYKALLENGEQVVRARVAYAIQSPSELGEALRVAVAEEPTGGHRDWLRFRLLKFFYDGSGLARTGLVYEDWCRDGKPVPGARGIRVTSPSDAEQVIKEALSRGVRVIVHAIGDRAVDEVLEAYARAAEGPVADCSLSIVHAFLVSPKGFNMLRETRVCVKTQTGFIYSHGHVYAGNFCEYRARRSFPVKSLRRLGIVVANGTDAPFVGSPSPGDAVYGAVYRRPRLGQGVFGDSERVSFLEALESFTYGSALATGWSDIVGVLEPGKRADIVVWNIESLEPGMREVLGMKPLLVMVDGRIAYSSSSGFTG